MYYLVYGFLYLISLLPFFILYLISDFFYFIIYHVWGYRKDVVLNNLTIAFPKKSLKKKNKLQNNFIKTSSIILLKQLKLLSISKKQLQKRFTLIYAMLTGIINAAKIAIHLGHFFNWEYANLSLST